MLSGTATMKMLERSPQRLRLAFGALPQGMVLFVLGLTVAVAAVNWFILHSPLALLIGLAAGILAFLLLGYLTPPRTTLTLNRKLRIAHLTSADILRTRMQAAPLAQFIAAEAAPAAGDKATVVLKFRDRAPWTIPAMAKPEADLAVETVTRWQQDACHFSA